MSVVGIFVLYSEISDYIVVTTHVFNKNKHHLWAAELVSGREEAVLRGDPAEVLPDLGEHDVVLGAALGARLVRHNPHRGPAQQLPVLGQQRAAGVALAWRQVQLSVVDIQHY